MAEIAKEDIDAIVSAIGFGIVSDFRSLQTAMRVMTEQSNENNRLLGEVNQHLDSTDKSLERLEKDIYRQINTRQFTDLENAAEKKAKSSSKRADQILGDVQKSLSNLQKETAKGINRDNIYARTKSGKDDDGEPSSDAEVGQFLNEVEATRGLNGATALLPGPASSGGGIGMGLAAGGLAVAAVGAGVGAAYLMKNDSESSAAALTPAEAPAPSTPSIGVTQNNRGTSTQAPTASTTGAVSAATQNVSAVTTTLRSKALAKITNKLIDWINKNSDKVNAIIGPGNIDIFGKLVGDTFTFNKYMTDNSWTGLGEQYVLGNSIAPGQTKNQNAAYVAGVVVNLAILAYLACRDIYTKENYEDIQSGAILNFDDLGSSEKTQYVKNAGSQIENYVNKLISESRAKSTQVVSDTVSVTPPPVVETPGAGLAPSGGMPSEPETNESSETGLGSGSVGTNTVAGGVGAAMGGATALASSGGDLQQATSMFEAMGASQPGSQGGNNGDATAFGGNNIASFSTSNDVLSDISGSGKAAGASWGSSSERANIVMNTLMSNGFSNEQAIDMTANFMQESGQNLDSGAVGDKAQGLNSFGIGQWNRERKQRLIQFAKERGKPVTDLETQTLFAVWEMNNTHKRAGANFFAARDTAERYSVLRHQYEVGIENKKAFYAARKLLEGADYENRSDSATQPPPEEEGAEGETTATVPAAAKGAIITPLPKAPTDTINLAPPRIDGGSADDDDDEFTSTTNPIDARAKSYSANPKDEVKNKLSFYEDYMQHHFGFLSKEFDLHTSGELTADEAYRRAMNPLGR